MAGGVARRIPLCFNDDSAQPRCREIVDQRLPDQILRKLHRSHRQVRPAKALEAALKGVHCDHLLPSSALSAAHRDNYGSGKNYLLACLMADQEVTRTLRDVCLWHKADIDADDEHVRFWG